MLTASKSLVQLAFVIDQERIAAEECVERNVPDSCCHGKCVLQDRLEAIDTATHPEGEEQQAPELPEIALVLPSVSTPCFSSEPVRIRRFCGEKKALTQGHHLRLLKPPQRMLSFSLV